jgi:hypothetical protein
MSECDHRLFYWHDGWWKCKSCGARVRDIASYLVARGRKLIKTRVDFKWMDEYCAGVDAIVCRCGYEDHEVGYVEDEDEWECPRCGNRIRFVWVGMTWEEGL